MSSLLRTSVAVAVSMLAIAHCGGQVAQSNRGGDSSSGGDDGKPDSGRTDAGAPVEAGVDCPTTAVELGGPCDFEGTCSAIVCDGQSTTFVACTDGIVTPVDGETACTVGVACPKPSVVASGGTCVTGEACASDNECGGTDTCDCVAGAWSCPVPSCGKSPPPAICMMGGECAQGPSSCTIPSGGPCGSDESLTCENGSYVVSGYPCSNEGSGCGTASTRSGCSSSCTCDNGEMVCSTTCPVEVDAGTVGIDATTGPACMTPVGNGEPCTGDESCPSPDGCGGLVYCPCVDGVWECPVVSC